MNKKLIDKLTRKEFHLWMSVCSGLSLRNYANSYGVSHGYIKCHLWRDVKKKLKLKGNEWMKYVDKH
jgi:DNA-binding CsgD family transcriptional regulator